MSPWEGREGAVQLLRVCCMGVLDDEEPLASTTVPVPTLLLSKDEEKHTRDAKVKEKFQPRKKKSEDSDGKWREKPLVEKREIYRDTPTPRTVKASKISEARPDEDKFIKSLRRKSSEENNCDSNRLNRARRNSSEKHDAKRSERQESKPQKSGKKTEPRVHRKLSPQNATAPKPRICRKTSPLSEQQPPQGYEEKNLRHCRHISDSGDLTSYRSKFFEKGYDGERPPFMRSSSVRTNRGGRESVRSTTLRCGCKVPLYVLDNRHIELRKSCSEKRQLYELASPRQRKESPSPHVRPPYKRW